MRALTILALFLLGCSQASPLADEPRPMASAASATDTAPAAPPPASNLPPTETLAASRVRLVNERSEVVVEIAPDGRVTGLHFPSARLEDDSRLVIDGRERVFRLEPNGELRDGDEVFGRFVDDRTLLVDPNLSLTVTEDGTVTLSVAHSSPATGDEQAKVLGRAHMDAKDPASRKVGLFALASEAYASSPLAPSGPKPVPSKTEGAAAAGVAAVGLAALLALEVVGTAREHAARLKPLKARVRQERLERMDPLCATQQAAHSCYRYAGGTGDERAELGRLESCVPLPGRTDLQYFCCLR
jgi:hypothetical protein